MLGPGCSMLVTMVRRCDGSKVRRCGRSNDNDARHTTHGARKANGTDLDFRSLSEGGRCNLLLTSNWTYSDT
jgi:hypothetical protein